MLTPFSVTSLLDFLKLGVESNWWGLSCPSHCGPPSWTALGLSALTGLGFGLFLGFGLACALGLRLGLLPFALRPPVVPPVSRPSAGNHPGSRIQAYLYE